ncbi:MAG: DNA polymerase III subunit delta [Longimicrobiales bacterium]
MSPTDAVARALSKGPRGGVFFLHGEEEYLKEEAAAAIVAAHLDAGTRDFNYDQLRAGDVEPETLASILQTPPMMADWRVVVVRDTQAIATQAQLRAVIEDVVAQPPADLALVLIATLPSRSRAQVWERIKRETAAFEFAQLSATDVPGWLIERAQQSGVELEIAAARALAGAIGPELGVLTQELGKLIGYVGDRKRIATEDVAAIVGSVPRQNRWDWFDLVGAREFRDARAGLQVLLDENESGVGLVIGLGTHFLRLALAARGGERALGESLPPHQRWLAQRLAKQARHWHPDALDRALADLLRADRLLKSASLDQRQIMEELLLRLQQRAHKAAA